MVETLKALVSAETKVYEVEKVVDSRNSTVTNPSNRGTNAIMPMIRKISRNEQVWS